MRALAKLVTQNEPDMVLFVGEALVGNDGIDQLQLFNQVRVRLFALSFSHRNDSESVYKIVLCNLANDCGC